MTVTYPTTELGKVADLSYGYTASASFACSTPKFLRITDIQNGIVNWKSVPGCEIAPNEHARHRLAKHDIVFARTGATTGKSYLIQDDVDAVAASYLIRLRLTSASIDPYFVWYFFQSAAYWNAIARGTTGSAQGGFNASKLGALQLPTPPIAVQKQIVTFLDAALERVARAMEIANENLERSSELFWATLSDAFADQVEWTSFELGARVRFIDYRGKTPPKTDGGIRLITAKNVKMGFLQQNPEEFVDPDAYDAWMTRGLPKIGDVLFTTEAPLGNVSQLTDDEKVMIGQRLITMRPRDDFLVSDFLKWMLMSPQVQRTIKGRATGATVQGIKASLLKTIPLAAPSRDEQVKIAQRLQTVWEGCEGLTSHYRSKVKALSELRAAVIQKAFSGDLVLSETLAA